MLLVVGACLVFVLWSLVKHGLVLDRDRLAQALLRELRRELSLRGYARTIELRTPVLDVACVQTRLATPDEEAEAQVALEVVLQQARALGDSLSDRWQEWAGVAALLSTSEAVAPLRVSDLRLPELRAVARLEALVVPMLVPPLRLRLRVGVLRLGLVLARRALADRHRPTRVTDAGSDMVTLARASVAAYRALLHAPAAPAGIGLDPIA